MHAIRKFAVHIIAAPWICSTLQRLWFLRVQCKLITLDYWGPCCLTKCVYVCVSSCVRSQKEERITWNVLSSRVSSSGLSPAPASSQGGVFPISIPILSISVCLGIQVGVYPLHTRHTFPTAFSLSQDSSHWISFILLLSLDYRLLLLLVSPPPPPLQSFVYLLQTLC